MKISDRTYFLILVVMILGLSYMSYNQFNRFGRSLGEVKLPEIEIPETGLENFFVPAEEENLTWLSPEEDLQLTYPSSWTEADEALLDYFAQAGIILPDTELLFFANKIDQEKQSPALLTINRSNKIKTVEEIMAEIEVIVKEQEGNVEFDLLSEQDGISWLDMSLSYPNQVDSLSRNKIMTSETGTYLIVFSSYQSDWSKFEEEAQRILGSAQFGS